MDPTTEEDRLREAAEFDADEPGWVEANRPGTLGCHELLDRTALVSRLLQEAVVGHPACVARPEWYALAGRAAELLEELYQAVGAEHCEPAASD